MITYKPSTRLGLLNEENFTTDPSSRGWTETVVLGGNESASTSFDATNGYEVFCNNDSSIVATLENTNIMLKQYLRIQFFANSMRQDSPIVSLYLNNTLVKSFGINTSTDNTGNNNIYIDVFKNTKNEWLVDYVASIDDGSGNEASYNTVDLDTDTVNSIKIVINADYDPSTYGITWYTTGLKWV